MKWIVRPDGSFDLEYDGGAIRGAYPGIDGAPVRAVSVSMDSSQTETTILYSLLSGSLSLRLESDGHTARMRCRIEGMAAAPESIEPLGWGTLPHVRSVFKQGRGMCGGSEFCELLDQVQIESTALVSVMDAAHLPLTVWVCDTSRFECRFSLDRIERHGSFRLTASFSTERIPLVGGACELPGLSLAASSELSHALGRAVREIADTMHARPIRPPSYHWCSWYYLYHNLDMPLLCEYLAGLAGMDSPPSLDYFQIDAGYFPSLGDWLEPSPRFPEGLKPAFEAIRNAGYRPGIWIGPFMVGNRSKLAREHPEWLLRDLEGHLMTPWKHYGEPKVWGYRDEEAYVLDTSHPDAFEYLRSVFRTLRSWGADMFKTDFMYWGYVESHRVCRHTPGKTSVEYFRDLLAMIREEIGEETYWLGCIAPFFPFLGYADAMRVGGDVGVSWSEGFGPKSMLLESVGNQHFNQVFWQNDPDVLLVRDFHSNLSSVEVTSLAIWQAILGGVVATSDPLHEISADRLALWESVRPTRNTSTATLPLLNQPARPLVAVRDLGEGEHLVFVFNKGDLRVRDRFSLEALGISGQYYASIRSVTEGELLGFVNELSVDLEPHASILFHLGVTQQMRQGPLLGQ